MSLSKPLDQIEEEDLRSLLGTTSEGLALEFKRDAPCFAR